MRRQKRIIILLAAFLTLLICLAVVLFIRKLPDGKDKSEVRQDKGTDIEVRTEEKAPADVTVPEVPEEGHTRPAPDLSGGTAESIPICMYHYVYDAGSPPENIDANFIEVSVLEEELKYLKDNGYYFPTWSEVRDFLDGNIQLPKKSIVLSFDDGPSYIELAIPLLEKYQVYATSFVITSYYDSKEMLDGYRNEYLAFESHSHAMHVGGGSIGHGGIFTALSKEEALADLEQSAQLCGSKEAFAYPFGDYTAECEEILAEAGFLCAVTTEPGKSAPGDDPYALPRVRMSGNQSLEEFVAKIQ